MKLELSSQPETSQHGDGSPPIAPYPLGPATMRLWLRRGERLGQMMRGLAKPIPALVARAWSMLGQVATEPPADPPTEASQ